MKFWMLFLVYLQVISASAKYKNITLSDPVEANRRVLKQYMNDTSEDQRWMQNFKLIAQLEGDEKVCSM